MSQSRPAVSSGRPVMRTARWLALVAILAGCGSPGSGNDRGAGDGAEQPTLAPDGRPPAAGPGRSLDLWQGGGLHGANLYQRRLDPAFDPARLLADGAVGPRYEVGDIEALAAAGANLAVLSHPGIFTETAPYRLDEAVAANLRRLVDQAHHAGLAVVIAIRTGPGRSETTFLRDELGTWFSHEQLIEDVWSSAPAQDGWVEMWAHLAETYRHHPAVVGYDLMVEPNAATVVGPDDPERFVAERAGTLADWNQLHPRLAAAIRAVDPTTPLLVEPDGWGEPSWLASLDLGAARAVVPTVHVYAPYQLSIAGDRSVTLTDASAAFADDLETASQTAGEAGRPLAVLEFGVHRDPITGPDYLGAALVALADVGAASAVWLWEPADHPAWPPDPLGFSAATPPSDRRWQALVEHWGVLR